MDPKRYLSLARVLAGLLLSILVVNFAMGLAFQDLGQVRIRRQANRMTGVTADSPCVLLGLSTMGMGVDPEYLESKLGSTWLNLAGAGRLMADLERYSRPMLERNLHPRLIVVGVHPMWLANRGFVIPKVLSKWFWLARRPLIREDYADLTGQIRSQLKLLQVERDAEFVVAPKFGHALARHSEKQLRVWRDDGYFNPGSYVKDSQAEIFSEVLEKLSGTGAQIVIVLMPESTRLREKVPPVAGTKMLALAGEHKVLDLRASLPDDYFWDVVHLNIDGRQRLSAELALELEKLGFKATQK